MKNDFNKGLILTSLGSFWWGFIGVIYFESVSFIGHTELVVHRCLWTAIMLILTTTFLSKWKIFLKEVKDKKKLIALFLSGFLIFVMMWFRWTFPRLRTDQLMRMCWKFFLPGSFFVIIGVGLWDLIMR